MYFSRRQLHIIHLVALVFLMRLFFGMPGGFVVQAQEPDESFEALALRAHRQGVRLQNYTAWSGGKLGLVDAAAMVNIDIGTPLDPWRLRGLDGDDDLNSEELARPTLLNFWASWCSACSLEFPHLVDVALAPEDHEFDVVFVNTADEQRDALAYLADFPTEIHTVVDRAERMTRHNDIFAYPTSLLLDADGTVLAVHVGTLTPTGTDLLNAIVRRPDEATFVPTDYEDKIPTAILLPVDVASAIPITVGETVSGTITHETFQHAYQFEGHVGDTVGINLTADMDEVDTYLVLIRSDGERLAENDDIDPGEITNSLLEVILPANDTYLVVATRFLEAEGFGEGDFELVVTVTSDDEMAKTDLIPPAQSEGTLYYGEAVFGELNDENYKDMWSFEAQAGDIITLTMAAAGDDLSRLDGYLILNRPDDTILAEVDDSGGIMPTLEAFELPTTGSYTVIATRFGFAEGMSSGSYTLLLDTADGGLAANSDAVTDTDPVPPAQSEGTLYYGEAVLGELNDNNYEDMWSFEAQAGDIITLTMTATGSNSGALDGYLILKGPDDTTLAEIDDYESVMPTIDAFELPATGSYTVTATRFGFAEGLSSGEYTLVLDTADAIDVTGVSDDANPGTSWLPTDGLPPNLGWIVYNHPTAGMLTPDNYDHWYIFRGAENDVITLRMTAASGDLDPFLLLTDANGDELARNDDLAGDTSAAAITEFTLSTTGTYFVLATRYGFANGPSAGDYVLELTTDAAALSLNVDDAPATALAYGTATTGTLHLNQAQDRYTFEGTAGDWITLSAQSVEGDIFPALTLYDPDGTEIAVSQGGITPLAARIMRFMLPADGTYALNVLLDNPATAGTYRLLLLPAAPIEITPGAFEPGEELDIELVLIWASEVDLDLTVQSPAGVASSIYTSANDFCADPVTAPVERITWEEDTAVPGIYTLQISYQFNCMGQSEPVDFILAIVRNGAIVDFIGGALVREGDNYTTQLEYMR